MPIRFRCGYCNKLLGIARRKAGSETTCPQCGYTLTVPDDPGGDTMEMEDLDELLNPVSSPAPSAHSTPAERTVPLPQPKIRTKDPATNGPSPSPSASPHSPSAASPRSTSTATADSRSPGERPLFERSVDDVLGTPQVMDALKTTKPKTEPTSGIDALTLNDDRSQIVLSVQKATLLAIAAVLLIGLSFAAGYLLASTK